MLKPLSSRKTYLANSAKRPQANFIQIFCLCQSKRYLGIDCSMEMRPFQRTTHPVSLRGELNLTLAWTINANNNHFIICLFCLRILVFQIQWT